MSTAPTFSGELDEQIGQRLRHIRQLRESPDVSDETREEVDELIPWRKLRDEGNADAAVVFMQNYIEEEARDRSNDKPLCYCGDAECLAKKGRLPAQVKPAPGPFGDSVASLVQSYLRGHPCVVLREAWEERQESQATIYRDLEKALARLERDVDSRGIEL